MTNGTPQSEMRFFDHVDELRVRIIRCMVVFFVGFILCYSLANQYVFDFLKAPLFAVLPEGQRKLHFTSLFENFLTHLKIAGVSSLFLFSPYYFYQFWRFVAPGLKHNEKKYVIPFVSVASFFFIGGAAFAYQVLFPVAFRFFVYFGSDSDVPMLTIAAYYGTALKLMVLFGLAFELPVLVCFLGALGIVSGKMLREQRKTAIIMITVGSGAFAPPDAISMILLMVPLILLYEISIRVVDVFDRKRTQTSESEPK